MRAAVAGPVRVSVVELHLRREEEAVIPPLRRLRQVLVLVLLLVPVLVPRLLRPNLQERYGEVVHRLALAVLHPDLQLRPSVRHEPVLSEVAPSPCAAAHPYSSTLQWTICTQLDQVNAWNPCVEPQLYSLGNSILEASYLQLCRLPVRAYVEHRHVVYGICMRRNCQYTLEYLRRMADQARLRLKSPLLGNTVAEKPMPC